MPPPKVASSILGTGAVRIGIFLAGLPRMLQDILQDILRSHADFEVVALAEAASPESARRHALDGIVTCVPDAGAAEPPLDLLRVRDHVRVLAIEPDGRKATLFELKPVVRRLDAISPGDVVAALRHGTGWDPRPAADG